MEMDGSCWVGCTARRACLRCGAVRIVGDETRRARNVGCAPAAPGPVAFLGLLLLLLVRVVAPGLGP